MRRTKTGLRLFILFYVAVAVTGTLQNEVRIAHAQGCASMGTETYNQDFNILATNGSFNTDLPSGWSFTESGTGANTTYAADNGALVSGNTYSYGTTGQADRALGSLLSGSVQSRLGACFINTSGQTITALSIGYNGEQWRRGVSSNDSDRLDFSYSLDATSLQTGTWEAVDQLDFVSLSVNNFDAGAQDGNAAANRTQLSFTITGLSIAPNARIFIAWWDADKPSNDDGLAIDDVTITPTLQSGDCDPRPRVRLTRSSGGLGVLNVTVQADSGAISFVDFGTPRPMTNASVSVVGGPTNQTGPFRFTPQGGPATVQFSITSGNRALPSTVPFTVTDTCGSWPTFVGGGKFSF